MTASFIGHRHIRSENSLLQIIHREIYTLIARKSVDTFLFGSRSRFDDICLKIVSDMKTEFPHIKRIYVRAEYPIISKSYTDYLLRIYDGTFFPSEILNAGKAIYVERNRIMIDNSDFCIFSYDKPVPATNFQAHGWHINMLCHKTKTSSICARTISNDSNFPLCVCVYIASLGGNSFAAATSVGSAYMTKLANIIPHTINKTAIQAP